MASINFFIFTPIKDNTSTSGKLSPVFIAYTFDTIEYNSDNIKYISKETWEVYYKDIFLGIVKNTEQARIAIRTAKLILEMFNK